MDFQRGAELPEPLIYHALEAFMEIYEDMWKYVECDDSQFHILHLTSFILGLFSFVTSCYVTLT